MADPSTSANAGPSSSSTASHTTQDVEMRDASSSSMTVKGVVGNLSAKAAESGEEEEEEEEEDEDEDEDDDDHEQDDDLALLPARTPRKSVPAQASPAARGHSVEQSASAGSRQDEAGPSSHATTSKDDERRAEDKGKSGSTAKPIKLTSKGKGKAPVKSNAKSAARRASSSKVKQEEEDEEDEDEDEDDDDDAPLAGPGGATRGGGRGGASTAEGSGTPALGDSSESENDGKVHLRHKDFQKMWTRTKRRYDWALEGKAECTLLLERAEKKKRKLQEEIEFILDAIAERRSTRYHMAAKLAGCTPADIAKAEQASSNQLRLKLTQPAPPPQSHPHLPADGGAMGGKSLDPPPSFSSNTAALALAPPPSATTTTTTTTEGGVARNGGEKSHARQDLIRPLESSHTTSASASVVAGAGVDAGDLSAVDTGRHTGLQRGVHQHEQEQEQERERQYDHQQPRAPQPLEAAEEIHKSQAVLASRSAGLPDVLAASASFGR